MVSVIVRLRVSPPELIAGQVIRVGTPSTEIRSPPLLLIYRQSFMLRIV